MKSAAPPSSSSAASHSRILISTPTTCRKIRFPSIPIASFRAFLTSFLSAECSSVASGGLPIVAKKLPKPNRTPTRELQNEVHIHFLEPHLCHSDGSRRLRHYPAIRQRHWR